MNPSFPHYYTSFIVFEFFACFVIVSHNPPPQQKFTEKYIITVISDLGAPKKTTGLRAFINKLHVFDVMTCWRHTQEPR